MTSYLNILKKLLCKHLYIVHFEKERIYMICANCQHETTGWQIIEK